jgi:hypothetical protein
MKTFTEFSTLVLRRAAAAKAANSSLEGDALLEAIATALGSPAERVPRLLEALEIVGDNIEGIRLVRVYQGETGPLGSVSRGEFHYALDRVAGAGGGRRERPSDRGGDRGGRGGGDRGGRGGGGGGPGGGGGGPGGDRGRDKPRGLGSLMKLAAGEKPKEDDDRPQRGEIPRAGLGWQLTSAPREFRDDKGGRGGPRKGGPRPPGRGRPGGGPGGPGGGPGGDDRGRRAPRPMGDRPPRGPRIEGAAGPGGPGGERAARPPRDPNAPPRPPRDPNAPRRERRPLGPDANGMGPDGKPWDPERKTKRDAERAARPEGDQGAQAPADVAAPTAAPSEE